MEYIGHFFIRLCVCVCVFFCKTSHVSREGAHSRNHGNQRSGLFTIVNNIIFLSISLSSLFTEINFVKT